MTRAFLILLAMAAPAVADVNGPAGKTIECYCTDTQGARVELGEQICLFVGGRAFMAKCDMSLNVPMWRETGEGCISSSLTQSPAETPTQQLLNLANPAG